MAFAFASKWGPIWYIAVKMIFHIRMILFIMTDSILLHTIYWVKTKSPAKTLFNRNAQCKQQGMYLSAATPQCLVTLLIFQKLQADMSGVFIIIIILK